MEKELKWAVLGTGVIANEMAQALQKMGKKLYAVANRTYDKAVEFAEKYAELCDIHKSNQIESNSQQVPANLFGEKGCVISTKVIKLKAIHNPGAVSMRGRCAV